MKKLNIFCIAGAMTCLTLPCTAGTPEGKIAFNPEPSDNRPFGISVGLVTKQISDGSTKTPWMMLDQIATGKMDKKSSPSFQIGFSGRLSSATASGCKPVSSMNCLLTPTVYLKLSWAKALAQS